jgi:hypothetical protein
MNSDIEINHQWSLFTPLGAKRDGTKRTQALENRYPKEVEINKKIQLYL